MMASPGPHSATRKGTYGLGDGVEEDLAAGTAAARGGQQGSLTSFGRLAALSLDALSSVPYGPQAIVLVLVAAGTSVLRLTMPVTLAIAGLLAVLVVSYCQVIAVHRRRWRVCGGKTDLGATVSLLAAASLVVDYVRQAQQGDRQVAVLIPEIQPRRWRYHILQNRRGLLLATVLRASTDAVICTIPCKLNTR